MKYFTELINQSLNRTHEATLSILGVNNENLRQHLFEQMSKELGSKDCFLASPVFEHTFGWKEGSETLQDLSPDLISESFLHTLDTAQSYKFPKQAKPYTHQLQAWRSLMSDKPQSAVITSGTGSGKTECFMIPILDDLVREQEKNQQSLIGVRALFLYPLNALINSQQERLDAWTKAYEQKIRFCLYNGKTEESESKVRKLQAERPNQILSRELLRKEPAPLLMTNATMLEYMLVRQVDSPIIEISKKNQSLRWIVLDEAHTYIGSQAAEMSLLLRRVVQAFGKKPEEIRFVATSATMAGDDAKEMLQKYLADLAGVGLDQVVVITGSRTWPAIDLIHSNKKVLSLDEIRAIEPDQNISEQRFQALCENPLAVALRQSLVGNTLPRSLNDLVLALGDRLSSNSMLEKQQEVLGWLDVLTGTQERQDSPPFLKLRIHLFQRMLHGLWACVDPSCTSKPSYLNNWPFGSVYLHHRSRCDCGSPAYELGFCNECRTPHLIAEDVNGYLHQQSLYVADEFKLEYEDSVDETNTIENEEAINESEVNDSLESTSFVGKVVLAASNSENPVFIRMDLDVDTLGIGTLDAQKTVPIALAQGLPECSHCGYVSQETGDFLKKAYLGAPFYVANAAPTILEYCPDPSKDESNGWSPEELPGRGRKLITFTDSRQGTARMAVRMQQEAERSRLRGLVFSNLQNAQIKQNLKMPSSQDESINSLLSVAESLEAQGLSVQAEVIRNEVKKKNEGLDNTNQRIVISWEKMLEDLAASKDIEQSILQYNRYANPLLFDESSGPKTMARVLLAREFSRRPKNQNSTETLGLIKIGYDGLDKIVKAPESWLDTFDPSQERVRLTLEDWKDFLKVTLDFYVRENTFIRLDESLRRWMGSRFTPKSLYAPDSNIVESHVIRKWPQAKKGASSRLVKLLEAATQMDKSIDLHKAKINLWLNEAWRQLIEVRVLEPVENGYTLRLDTLNFSLPLVGWVCPLTHRVFDTTFRGLTPYLPHKYLGIEYRCEKIELPDLSLIKVDETGNARVQEIRKQISENQDILSLRMRNLWTDISDRTVEGGFYYRTAEHSAQQSDSKLESYVEQFKKGTINVLNCSTTMEMGVDIGGISAVLMNNVPPHPANYLQRAGRAGRRSESRAIGYTLCKMDPHNQRAFTNPKWPFETSIPAPIVTLSSARIVQRHVNALLLSLFLRKFNAGDDDNTKLTSQWFYVGATNSPCNIFITWLEANVEEYENEIRKLVVNTPLATQSMFSITEISKYSIRNLQEKWLDEYKQINQKIQLAKDDAYRKALELEKKRHEQEYLLRDLASRAFLPGYGFPTNVVSLNTYNIEDYQFKKAFAKSREDSIFNHKELPSRDLAIAIREYAPGAQIVIDGRVHRSAGVNLQLINGKQDQTPQNFDIAWRCNNCGTTGVKEYLYSSGNELTCTHCQTPIEFRNQLSILRPNGFVTDFYESTSNDVSSQKFIQVERPRVQLKGNEVSFPDPNCGYVRYGHSGSVFYHSSGENYNGYAVCMSCGRSESMLASGDVPKLFEVGKNHRPVGGGSQGSRKALECSNNWVKPNVYLGFQVVTDVFEMFLRSPEKNSWLSDDKKDQIIAYTLAVATRNVVAEKLGISAAEMGVSTRLDKDLESKKGRSVIQIYDTASGGAGFSISALNDLPGLLRGIYQQLTCDCENVCSKCLTASDSRIEKEVLDRKGAKKWLEESKILEHFNLPDEFNVLEGANYCSVGPLQYLAHATNRLDSQNKTDDCLVLFLRGNLEEWCIDAPHFTDLIMSWKLNKRIAVRIAISDSIQVSEEIKRSLLALKQLGIGFVSYSLESQPKNLFVAAQIYTVGQCTSLISNNVEPLVPNDSWLVSDPKTVWVSSDKFLAVESKAFSSDYWTLTERTSHVLEIGSELDGPINKLGDRFRELISNEIPELGKLLSTDKAISLEYSDRYLKSPWTLMILSGFLGVFKNTSLENVSVLTMAVNSYQRGDSRMIFNDWVRESDQKFLIEFWLKKKLSTTIHADLRYRANELKHGRSLVVKWASGNESKIFFDQGMGSWQVKMFSRIDAEFNFYNDFDKQVAEMVDKYDKVSMRSNESLPTHMSFIIV